MKKLVENHWYRFNDKGDVHVGQSIGTASVFECCARGKGCKAYTFNVWYDENECETWGYARGHLPEILEDLGEHEDVIIDV